MYASMWQMHHLKHLGNSRFQKKKMNIKIITLIKERNKKFRGVKIPPLKAYTARPTVVAFFKYTSILFVCVIANEWSLFNYYIGNISKK